MRTSTAASAVPERAAGSTAATAARLLRHVRWFTGVQCDLIRAAWHGRNHDTTRAGLRRFGYGLWAATSANTLPTRGLADLFPGIRCDVRLRSSAFDPNHRFYRTYTHHVCVLASLVKHLRPRRIFEIGTFEGEMTLNFALNAPDGAEIFTLDLPSEHTSTQLPSSSLDLEMVRKRRLGERFRDVGGLPATITQLSCDSAAFDPTPFASSCDFIYVDGAHTAEYVANDTRLALRMLRPGGVILWDDYNWYWKGLVREVQRAVPGAFHIAATELAIYIDGRT